MRGPISKEDHELDEALIWDYFGRVYGWTKQVVQEQLPDWLPPRLLTIGTIRTEIEREEAEKDRK